MDFVYSSLEVTIRHIFKIRKFQPCIKYERLLITFWGLMAIIGYILQRLNLAPVYTAGFHQLRRTNCRSFFIYPWVLFQLLGLSYLLAIGVNVATYYAHPAWNNYGEFSSFALFGYNENPLTDLWAGFDRALIFLVV
jgi:hypothetical protein